MAGRSKLEQAYLDYLHQLHQFDLDALDELRNFYDDMQTGILEELQDTPEEYQAKRKKLAGMLQMVTGYSTKISDLVNRLISAGAQSGVEAGWKLATDSIIATGLQPDKVPLSEKGAVLTALWQEKSPLWQQLSKQYGETSAYIIADTIKQAVIMRWSVKKTTDRISQVTGIQVNKARSIVRTEITRAASYAAISHYRKHPDVKGWIWVAHLSEHSCRGCIGMHGTVHPLGEFFPLHTNCRCSPQPFLGKPYPHIKNAEKWLKSKSEHMQKKVLGDAWQLWKTGQIKLRDLAGMRYSPVYGHSVYARSLTELQAIAAGKKPVASQPVNVQPPPPQPVPEPDLSDPVAKAVYDDAQKLFVQMWSGGGDPAIKYAKLLAHEYLTTGKVPAAVWSMPDSQARKLIMAQKAQQSQPQPVPPSPQDQLLQIYANHMTSLGMKPVDAQDEAKDMLHELISFLKHGMRPSSDLTNIPGIRPLIRQIKQQLGPPQYPPAKPKTGPPLPPDQPVYKPPPDMPLRKYDDDPQYPPAVDVQPVPLPPVQINRPPVRFPSDAFRLQVVKSLGGSTGAKLVEDEYGNRFVMKRGRSPAHIQEEYLANKLYEALGVPVPRVQIYDTPDGPVMLAEYIEGKTLEYALQSASPEKKQKILQQIGRYFAADAALLNWDVAGLDYDNILIDKDGIAWRVDNGGALRYRAQGQQKTGNLAMPMELWTLRDPQVNAKTADLFGNLSILDIRDQLADLMNRFDTAISIAPEPLRKQLLKRGQYLREIMHTVTAMENDGFDAGYIDRFAYHTINLRNEGILYGICREADVNGVELEPPYDRVWDNLRGRDSIIEAFDDYLQKHGYGSFDVITHYCNGQASSSWDDYALAVKYWLCKKMNKPADYFYWRSTIRMADLPQKLQAFMREHNLTEQQMDEIFTAWHALQYVTLGMIDFPGNDVQTRTIRLYRSENVSHMDNLRYTPDKKYFTARRAVYESTAVFRPGSFGSDTCVYYVPHHRIFGMYFWSNPGSNGTIFYSDSENEFLAILDRVLGRKK